MKIIAFDSGGTTGWATFRGNTQGHFTKVGEITGPNHHKKLYHVLDQECNSYLSGSYTELTYDPPFIVLYERWHPKEEGDHSDEIPTNEYNGVIKLWGQNNEVVPIPQSSNDVLNWADNAKLRALGIYNDYKKPHATDAIRHIVYWLCNGAHDYDQYRDELFKKLKENLR